ncbi:MAG: TlpA family protein disulfide reductase [Gemmataceae bacterium]|nr:TlpA family protein disulfide reductase [Gemmataceae bacterium]
MATPRITIKALATLTLWAGFGLTATAQLPALTVDQALAAKPRQPGVNVQPPAADQVGRYKVEPIPGQQAGSNMGYRLLDAQGRPARQFVTYDNKQFNIVSYYADGVEVYREVVPPSAAEPHSYRWLGANGGKWGLDKDKNGTIDEWAVISPEEVGQELVAAVAANDANRLKALVVSDEHLKALGLPAGEAAKIKERAAGAAKRLADAAKTLNLSPEAKFVHLQLAAPQTTPGDAFGAGVQDLTVHKNGAVLIQDKDKTHFLQTGELLLVGRAWKVVEGPAAGAPTALEHTPSTGTGPAVTDANRDLVTQLHEHDKTAPDADTPPKQAEYHTKRAAILEQIIAKTPADKQADWVRLLVDSLAAAAEVSGKPGNPAHKRLQELNHNLAQGKGALAPYSAFRLLVAEHGMELADGKGDIGKIQERWRAGLEAFINNHPSSEDAGEAVLRLAMAYEFAGKDGEAKAKEWYGKLVKNYGGHANAGKAAGAVRRLDAEGQPLAIQGPVLGSGAQFTHGQLAGKAVVVYYWAAWSNTLGEDAKKLKELAEKYGPKGLAIVTVNLDDTPKQAADAVAATGLPGTHLHAAGGLDGSPLAAGYGVMVVPHLLVAGKDGKVLNRNAQVTTLEDDIKKALGDK